MITETANVIAVEKDWATVCVSVKSGCSQCQVKDDCGTSVIAKAFAARQQQFTLKSPWPVSVGDSVVIGIPEQPILVASLLLYIVPLLTLLSVSLLLNQVTNWHELGVLSVAFLVTLGSFLGVRRFLQQRPQAQFEPVLIRTLASSSLK